jgi:hypothetical protein
MTKYSGKPGSRADASSFNEAAFEKEYFPDGSFDDACEQGTVEVSDGKGNWRKAGSSMAAKPTLSPAIHSRGLRPNPINI